MPAKEVDVSPDDPGTAVPDAIATLQAQGVLRIGSERVQVLLAA
ncbi:MAG: hypothetical protein ACRDSF_08715 [Pseudonocardiaceae bacterium]